MDWASRYVIQNISLLFFAMAGIVRLARIWRAPRRWGVLAPWLLWALHGTVYYVSWGAYRLGWWDPGIHLLFTTWSTVLRLHGIMTLLYTDFVDLMLGSGD